MIYRLKSEQLKKRQLEERARQEEKNRQAEEEKSRQEQQQKKREQEEKKKKEKELQAQMEKEVRRFRVKLFFSVTRPKSISLQLDSELLKNEKSCLQLHFQNQKQTSDNKSLYTGPKQNQL